MVYQNESERKEIVGLKDDNALHIKESNQIQPMEIANYESQKGTSVGNKDQVLDVSLGEKDICLKLQLERKMYNETPREKEAAAQITTKALPGNINQETTIANQIKGHNGLNNIQGNKDQVCTTALESYFDGSSQSLVTERLNGKNNQFQLIKDKQNEGRKKTNWKRMVRLVGASDNLNKDTKLQILNENIGEFVVV